MAHRCPTCGQACYCDLDDAWLEDLHGMPIDDACEHDCDPADLAERDDN